MFGLPASTEVNRRITKEKLYAQITLPASVKACIKSQIDAVIWRHKLSASSMNVRAGEMVDEIQLFEIILRQKELDRRILPALAKAIPYKILFVLTYGDMAQLRMDVSGTFYHTGWQQTSLIRLEFDGLNLDALYESLGRQIAGGRLNAAERIDEAVRIDLQRRQLERDMAALEKKILREKQFNRQVELHTALKNLRAEHAALEDKT